MRLSTFASLVLIFFPFSFHSFAANVSLPSYPLAVKSPYLSAWVPGKQLRDAATAQPEFWAGQSLTWTILARVGGTTYTLFGAPAGISSTTAATTNSITYTSSHTVVSLTAGQAVITLDFFSPLFPSSDDYAKHSLPYSYLTLNASSTGSTGQSVQILSAIDHTWTAQSGAAELNFSTLGVAGFFWFYNEDAVAYSENEDQATYGSVLFGTTIGTSVTYSCNTPENIYSQFVNEGILTAATTCSGKDLAALARDLGTVGEAVSSTTFAVGMNRDKAIKYLSAQQTGVYRTEWHTVPLAVAFFLKNYESAYISSLAFDATVRSRSEAVSGTWGCQYADIIEASIRQTFAALELTVPVSNLTADPSAFLKEISSDGNLNTVDLIYQSWPIFISLNPEYIKLLFKPILSYLASGQFPHPYVLHDMGTHYPNATGHNDGVEESMPLFETSTLFILLYTYQKYTADTAFAAQYSSLLDGYAQYLAANSLYPSSQLTSVDAIAAAPNQTALAIQSIIGLKAAGALLGNATYTDLTNGFAKAIYDDALGLDGETVGQSTHFTYNYGKNETWNVLFPSFSDVLLNLSTFPAEAWEMQGTWYLQQIQDQGLPFAGPVTDLNYTGAAVTWGLTDWNIVAAAASSVEVQEAVVSTTHAFLTNGLNTIPFGTKYYVEGEDVGQWIGNKARSTVGSHFAILVLQQGVWESGFY